MWVLAVLFFISFFKEYQQLVPTRTVSCLNKRYEMNNLQNDELKGEWWEYQSFFVINPLEKAYDCSASKFYVDGKNITIIQDFIRRGSGTHNTHTRRVWSLTQTPEAIKSGGVGTFSGETSKYSGDTIKLTFTVSQTDYKSWLMVFVCNEDKKFKTFRGAYVLTRKQTLTAEEMAEIDKNVQKELETRHRPDTPKRLTYNINQNSDCKPVTFPDSIAV